MTTKLSVMGTPIAGRRKGAYQQEGFKFRLDNGSETNARWIRPQDIDISAPLNFTVRLRILAVFNTDVPANLQLEYRKVGTLDWKKVT